MKYYNYKNKTNSDAILIDAYASKSTFLLMKFSFYFKLIFIYFTILFSCFFGYNFKINKYTIYFFIFVFVLGLFSFLLDYLDKTSPIFSIYKYIFYKDKISLQKGLSGLKCVTIKYDDITSVTLSNSLFLRKIEFVIYYKHCGVIKKIYTF